MRRAVVLFAGMAVLLGAVLPSAHGLAAPPKSPYTPREFAVVIGAENTPGPIDIYGDRAAYQLYFFGTTKPPVAVNLANGASFTADDGYVSSLRPHAIWADNLVWIVGYNPSKIEMYNLTSGKRSTLVQTGNSIGAVDLWQNVLVWLEYVAEPADEIIKARNLTNGQEYLIAAVPGYDINPRIAGDVVVWERSQEAGEQSDIYGFRFSTGKTFAVSANPWKEYSPAAYGDIVVWADERGGSYQESDIYARNLATNDEIAVCTAPGSLRPPAIWGDLVVWSDGRDEENLSGVDIYGYDLKQKQEFAVTRHIGSQTAPAIYGKTVVWQDFRNSPQIKYTSGDMYGATLLAQASADPLPVTGAPEAFDGLIEVVWPHSGRPGTDTDKANIGAFLFSPPGTKKEVPCSFDPPLQLWVAQDARPAQMVDETYYRTWNIQPATWHFNDVDVSLAKDPSYRLYFFLRVEGGYQFRTNVWAHAADARTFFPLQQRVTAALAEPPQSVDAVIQIVWPHEDKPVTEATLVNVSVNLFAPSSTVSVPADWSPRVTLYRSLNNGIGEPAASGKKRLVTEGSLIYPVWDFNDVDVSAARDPLNKYYFRVEVAGVETHSTIWAHGADARTYFPATDTPECLCNSCQ